MRGEEKLSALIGDIYDAALDPSRWEAVLTKSAEFVQGAGATHLGHVYEKTGTNRQADLVKLVAGFSSPIRR